MRRLCATVLVMEAIIIGLAIPVAITIGHASHAAGYAGGGLAVAAVLLAGVVGRPRMPWALVAGPGLRALVTAAGGGGPFMSALGVFSAAFWILVFWRGPRPQPPGGAPARSAGP